MPTKGPSCEKQTGCLCFKCCQNQLAMTASAAVSNTGLQIVSQQKLTRHLVRTHIHVRSTCASVTGGDILGSKEEAPQAKTGRGMLACQADLGLHHTCHPTDHFKVFRTEAQAPEGVLANIVLPGASMMAAGGHSQPLNALPFTARRYAALLSHTIPALHAYISPVNVTGAAVVSGCAAGCDAILCTCSLLSLAGIRFGVTRCTASTVSCKTQAA